MANICRFSGGMLNVCYNAVDRHVEAGNGNQTAIIYDSPVTGVVQHISYSELLHQVWSLNEDIHYEVQYLILMS